jgi:hypothetical protein
MGKEVKLERSHEVEDAKVVEESEPIEKSPEEINSENFEKLKEQMEKSEPKDLVGYVALFLDHESKRTMILSSVNNTLGQMVALGHGGYLDNYDFMILQTIITRTIESLRKNNEGREPIQEESPEKDEGDQDTKE